MACVNSIFGTLNFFDPACLTNDTVQDVLLQNLELGLRCKDDESFKKSNVPKYPAQSLLHDCGMYIILYAENFNGKIMKHFSQDIVPKYRMVKVKNEIEVQKYEKIKRKKM